MDVHAMARPRYTNMFSSKCNIQNANWINTKMSRAMSEPCEFSDHISVGLDDRDISSVCEIHEIFGSAGKLNLLLSLASVANWWDKKEVMPINIRFHDWVGVAKTASGLNGILMRQASMIAQRESLRHQLSGSREQREFWENFREALDELKNARFKEALN